MNGTAKTVPMQSDTNQTLQRAFALLDSFSIDRPELGVREVARLTGLSSSTAGRLLAALRDLGVLNQNQTTRTYSLGAKVLAWSGVYTAGLDVRSQALPVMEELLEQTQETISLYVLEGNERVCVERLESTQSVRIVARIGRRLSLYAGAGGKAILAFLPEDRREEILAGLPLKPLTSQTIIDPQALRNELEKIRFEGVAISHGEWILDASGVAAPILGPQAETVAALTISGPAQRFTGAAVDIYARRVARAALLISRKLGYSRGAFGIYSA